MISYPRCTGAAVVALLAVSMAACGSRKFALQYAPQRAGLGSQPQMTAQVADTAAPQVAVSQEQPDTDATMTVVPQAEPDTWLGHVQHHIDSLCHSSISQTSQLGLYIYDLTDGRPIYAMNPQHRMRPASCEKLVTCITLLDRMDGSMPLNTEVRVTGQVEQGTLHGDVYLAGDMDPMLRADDLDGLANALRQSGIDSIDGRVCELLPPYQVEPYGWGWCWDDDYGPLAPHLADGAEGIQQAWLAALGQAGIGLRSERVAEVSSLEGEAMASYSVGHAVCKVMNPLLKQSDNIYAECLFHKLASMGSHGRKARDRATLVVDSLITRLGLHPKDYLIADGSGLSLYNYVTPELLVSLLNHAYRTERIRQYLWPCLPVAGVDGTLEKRMRNTAAEGNVHAKTGTVEGISSLSGYLTAANGHIISFSIINQGVARTRTGQHFQDEVCLALCQ